MFAGRDIANISMIITCISVLRETLQAILMPASSITSTSSFSQFTQEWSIHTTYALGLIQLIGVFYFLSVAFKNMLMFGAWVCEFVFFIFSHLTFIHFIYYILTCKYVHITSSFDIKYIQSCSRCSEFHKYRRISRDQVEVKYILFW